MSAPKFTPGPWVAKFGGLTEIEASNVPRGPEGYPAIVAEVCDDGEDEAAVRADAFLIAAAPDLYLAVGVLLEAVATGSANHLRLAESAARAALAKAVQS